MAVTYSVEFFPPKDEAGEARLWQASEQLHALNLDFISVTYGAGGSTRDRTIRITKELQKRTGVNTVAHLTCVGSTKDELIQILNQYKEAGIKSILALRGDPTGGPTAEWVATPGGFTHADELVALAKQIGGFEIGVAAFPDGHPASHGDFNKDIDVLLKKEELGATFATTQFFFEAASYFKLVDALKSKGSKLTVIPGVLPITNVKQLDRMADLNGTPIPEKIRNLFMGVEDGAKVKQIGIELATNLCSELIESGAPGIHFYTMNTSESTLAIGKNLGILNNA
jgi:methylenetetrahydrofolate reductase (NADPH)